MAAILSWYLAICIERKQYGAVCACSLEEEGTCDIFRSQPDKPKRVYPYADIYSVHSTGHSSLMRVWRFMLVLGFVLYLYLYLYLLLYLYLFRTPFPVLSMDA